MYHLYENDIQTIEKLSAEKFTTWEWNFGYSPKYSFKNEVEIEGKILKIEMLVERGMISETEISGEYFTDVEALNIKLQLVGKRHNFEDLSSVLKSKNKKYWDFYCDLFF